MRFPRTEILNGEPVGLTRPNPVGPTSFPPILDDAICPSAQKAMLFRAPGTNALSLRSRSPIDEGGAAELEPIAIVVNGVNETPNDWHEVESRLVFKKDFTEGLYRIKESSRIWVIFGFHRIRGIRMRVRPRKAKDGSQVGIFASRGIQRPNRLGLTLVTLVDVRRDALVVRGLDAFDGSPVYDVKPYDPDYDR
jgi:tRNA-Thr(GGU) m(6)t(6)A37 methyltransferase TsaA